MERKLRALQKKKLTFFSLSSASSVSFLQTMTQEQQKERRKEPKEVLRRRVAHLLEETQSLNDHARHCGTRWGEKETTRLMSHANLRCHLIFH